MYGRTPSARMYCVRAVCPSRCWCGCRLLLLLLAVMALLLLFTCFEGLCWLASSPRLLLSLFLLLWRCCFLWWGCCLFIAHGWCSLVSLFPRLIFFVTCLLFPMLFRVRCLLLDIRHALEYRVINLHESLYALKDFRYPKQSSNIPNIDTEYI